MSGEDKNAYSEPEPSLTQSLLGSSQSADPSNYSTYGTISRVTSSTQTDDGSKRNRDSLETGSAGGKEVEKKVVGSGGRGTKKSSASTEEQEQEEERMNKTQASIRPSIWGRFRDDYQSLGSYIDSTTLSAFVRRDLEKYVEGIDEKEFDRPVYWIIVAAAFTVHFIADGIGFSFGVLLNLIQMEFHANKGTSGMAGAVLQAVPLLFFPVSGAISARIGFRITVAIGGIMAAASFAVSSCVTDIRVLIVTFGLIPGVGLGFCYHSAVIIVSLCFRKHKGIAMGVTVCGTAVGTISMAPLISQLVVRYGWRGSTLILSGTLFLLVVCGAIMKTPRRIETSLKKDEPKKKKKKSGKQSLQKEASDKKQLRSQVTAMWTIAKNDTIFLFTHPDLLWFVLSNFVLYVFYATPYNIGPAMFRSQGHSPSNSALIVSILGLTNLFGMIFFGLLIDWLENRHISKTILILIQGGTVIVCGGVCCVFPYATPYSLLIVLAAFYGFFISASYVNTHEVVSDMVPPKNITFFYGITCFFQGIGAFLGTPLAGMLYDKTSTYDASFLTSGGGIVAAGLLVLLSAKFRSKRVKQQAAKLPLTPLSKHTSEDTIKEHSSSTDTLDYADPLDDHSTRNKKPT